MQYEEYQNNLNDFLNRWHPEDVREMSLHEYVDIKNKDTFCQWVETKTRVLGSIKGMTSIKFGIYKRENPEKKPKNYVNGITHSWLKGYGSKRTEAFDRVKYEVLQVVELSQKGDFFGIDSIGLPSLYKWKVAFLYSNERLIPVFNRQVLFKIARHYGLPVTKKTRISEIQEVMISKKPAHHNVYSFMRELMARFGNSEEKSSNVSKSPSRRKQGKRRRKSASGRSTSSQARSGSGSYIAEQKHNKIQVALETLLVSQYGESNVFLEDNFVDVKLTQPDYLGFYEVKSASYASDCIKEALGQLLMYSHYDQDKRPKKLIVVGQYPPTEQDYEFIEYLKQKLKQDFSYLSIALDEKNLL